MLWTFEAFLHAKQVELAAVALCVHFSGLRLINLMGSHGVKAVAAALMGASATCVDISPSNAQYGQHLAAAAGVDVRFVVSDVLQLPESEHAGEWQCGWQQHWLSVGLQW
jgi:23S rRNA G2069 N7-methylase RlmK/C1962 C5-methylase RlmI